MSKHEQISYSNYILENIIFEFQRGTDESLKTLDNMMETIHRPQFSLMYCQVKPLTGQQGTKNMKTLQFGLLDSSQRLAKDKLSLDFRSIIILINRLLACSVSACSYYHSMKKSTRKKYRQMVKKRCKMP